MRKTYNAQTLAKFIRKEKKEKGKLMWQKLNGIHYISNGIWSVRTTKLEKDIQKLLLKTFGRKCPEGKILVYEFDDVCEKDIEQINVETIYVEPITSGKITPVALERKEGEFARMIVLDNGELVWINNDYLALLRKGVSKCKLLKDYGVQFGDDVIIMPFIPVRLTEILKQSLDKFFTKMACDNILKIIMGAMWGR